MSTVTIALFSPLQEIPDTNWVAIVPTPASDIFIDVVLKISGVVKRNQSEDPFVGFEKVYPLFGEIKKADGKIYYATNKNKLSFFNYQEFEKNKPGNTFRIFCFGIIFIFLRM